MSDEFVLRVEEVDKAMGDIAAVVSAWKTRRSHARATDPTTARG